MGNHMERAQGAQIFFGAEQHIFVGKKNQLALFYNNETGVVQVIHLGRFC